MGTIETINNDCLYLNCDLKYTKIKRVLVEFHNSSCQTNVVCCGSNLTPSKAPQQSRTKHTAYH